MNQEDMATALKALIVEVDQLKQRVEVLERTAASMGCSTWRTTNDEVVTRMESTGYAWEKAELELMRERGYT